MFGLTAFARDYLHWLKGKHTNYTYKHITSKILTMKYLPFVLPSSNFYLVQVVG